MIVVNCDQNTPEWLALKAGVPSSSNFDKIVQMSGKPSKQREKYMFQLSVERVTGTKEESYQNQAMLRGIEMEQDACNFYEVATGATLEKVGVVFKDEDKIALSSPDRLILGKNGEVIGLLEVKCPISTTIVSYLLNNEELKSKYWQQVQGQLYISGLPYCDLMAYYPGVRSVILRIERDEAFISALDSELKAFCKELDILVDKIS